MEAIFRQFADHVFNSREAIAKAIIGHVGFFRRQDFCYDHKTSITSNLLFVHSFMQLQVKNVRDVIFTLSGASFFHSRD